MLVVKLIFLASVATFVCARTTSSAAQNSIHMEAARSEESSSILGDLRYMYKVYKECTVQDMSSCLKLKLVSALDRATRSVDAFNVIEGVSFVKSANKGDDTGAAGDTKDQDIENNLPRSLEEREEVLNSMIVDKVSNFFQTHTLQVKFPSITELTEESRSKKKKSSYLLIPLLIGGTLIPIALGALALLAGKALLVSKLAIILAGILGLKKIFGGSSTPAHESGHHVEVVAGGHNGGWGRSASDEAQNIAYSAHKKTR